MPSPFTPDFQVDTKPNSLTGLAAIDPRSSPKNVAVLMCTYNGQRFLAEQLESIERQSHESWVVAVSDDGSTDNTLEIIESFRERWGHEKIIAFQGPKRGFATNFLTLACKQSLNADFFAWADQDDIWLENKLETAVSWLQTIPSETPALYCGRTQGVDTHGHPLECSPLFKRPPAFANALVQSLAGGNTMVFNEAARQLMANAGENMDIVSHDWWAYLLITGAGGKVSYDPMPFVLYRQHEDNLVGSNSGWKARLLRLRMMLKGRFSAWNEQNLHCLSSVGSLLTPENQRTLESFKFARKSNLVGRLLGLHRAGVYRQTTPGNIGLFFAAIMKGI
ncbi:glycosyltransferase family 2 protein [Pseudomonas sp. NPDC087342]|uniref:glycosyltransferase family 2 protein n=1 Tax=Pseudomonas sp. NPDC087342 TaxID=3364437 RepID=UPI0038137F56